MWSIQRLNFLVQTLEKFRKFLSEFLSKVLFSLVHVGYGNFGHIFVCMINFSCGLIFEQNCQM